MKAAVFAIATLLAAGCTPGREATAPADVRVVAGHRYDKGSYEDGIKTVVTFQIAVSNLGTDAGRSPDPACYTIVGDERVDLEVFENPHLEPGERGWLRTGGALPRMTPREAENLEPYCIPPPIRSGVSR